MYLRNSLNCFPPELKIRFGGGQAVPRRLERGERKLLGDDADIEVNQAGAGDVDADFDNGEPEEQILGGDAGELVDLAVLQGAGDVHVVVQFVLELGVAGAIQMHLELSRIIEGEVLNPFRQQPHREAVEPQDFVDGRLRLIGHRRRRREGE